MSAKLFGLDSGTVRRIKKLFALDGSTPRRVKKLFSLDGSSVRLVFEDFSTFTVSGTSNLIQSPVNEVIDFGVRSDFDAGGTDVNVNASGSGDTNNIGGVSGLSVDVDSNHTFVSQSDISGGNRPFANHPGAFQAAAGNNPARALVPQSSLVSPATSISALSQNVFGGTGSNFQNQNAFPNLFNGNTTITFSNGATDSTPTIQNQNPGGFQGVFQAGGQTLTFESRAPQFGNYLLFIFNGSNYPQIRVNSATTQATGRRARVQNGSNRPFNIQSGGLNAGGNFSTGNLNAGASTGFITANSTSEAFTLVGVATKNPATFSISNADNSITVNGTFGDGENASQARDRIQAALNGDSTFQAKFNTGVDVDKTVGGVSHKVVTFTSDTAENTSDFTITITQNDGSNTTGYSATTTQGVPESLQTAVTVVRAKEGSEVSSVKNVSSEANADTSGAEIASLGDDISYDASTNKIKVTDQDATINIANAGSLSISKD
tara:strand:- start:759 stop:2231 length:1473 start_codon:yes stop_codon:yes gene_type:complete